MRKKLLGSLLSVAMVASLLAGCGSDPAPATAEAPAQQTEEAEAAAPAEAAASDEEITITIWHQSVVDTDPVKIIIEDSVEEYHKLHPNVTIVQEGVEGEQYKTKIKTAFAAGEAPDISYMFSGGSFVKPYIDAGYLLPIDDYVSQDTLNNVLPGMLSGCTFDDKLYSLPTITFLANLYCNTEMFEAAGAKIPTTWDELTSACQAIKDFYKGEVYPWGIDMTTDEGQAAFAYYTWGNGGGFVDANNEWAVNSEANVEAIEYAVGLVKDGYTNPNPETQTRYDLQDMFAAGKLAMCIAPNSMPTYCADKNSTVNMATAAIPANEGKTSSSVGVMDRVMAFKDDAAPDQAARNEAIGKFLTFFYNPENYVGWVSMEGFLPAVNSAVSALVASDASFGAWLDVLASCQFYPTAKAEWDQVKQGTIAAEQAVLAGGDAKTELDKLQAALVK